MITAGCGIYLASYHFKLGLMLVLFMLAAGIGVPLLTGLLARDPGLEKVHQQADLNDNLVSWIQGQPDLMVFGQLENLRERITAISRSFGRIQQRLAWIRGLDTGLGELISNLAMWTILVAAVPLVSGGAIQGVNLAVVVLITLAAFEAVTPLPQAAQMLSSTHQAARRLFEVIDSQPEITDPADALPEPAAFRSLAFNHVSFSYEEDILPALQEISFLLEKGKHTAVVGPSGAGKSTLINLLLRFWEYEEGDILLNEMDLRRYRARDVRSRISLVSQNPYYFNATIAENIQIGWPDARLEDIRLAARRAHIDDFISSLPQGYETMIGENGMRLSAGQRRRLAIARALVKNAPFLLLDEPTSNLDPSTERELLSTLLSLLPYRTTMLITHRLIGLEYFDEIIVLDRGQVVESGKEPELLDIRGLYWRMKKSQEQILNTG
jgi:thiol reductant ABC exporter CydC subunit